MNASSSSPRPLEFSTVTVTDPVEPAGGTVTVHSLLTHSLTGATTPAKYTLVSWAVVKFAPKTRTGYPPSMIPTLGDTADTCTLPLGVKSSSSPLSSSSPPLSSSSSSPLSSSSPSPPGKPRLQAGHHAMSAIASNRGSQGMRPGFMLCLFISTARILALRSRPVQGNHAPARVKDEVGS